MALSTSEAHFNIFRLLVSTRARLGVPVKTTQLNVCELHDVGVQILDHNLWRREMTPSFYHILAQAHSLRCFVAF